MDASAGLNPFLSYPEHYMAERLKRVLSNPTLALPARDTSQPPRDARHVFVYTGGAKSVSLIGDWLEWDTRRAIPLNRSITGFFWAEVTLPLRRKLLYKFVVDGGSWLPEISVPSETDEHGNTNNVIQTGEAGKPIASIYKAKVRIPEADPLPTPESSPSDDGTLTGSTMTVFERKIVDENVLSLFNNARNGFSSALHRAVREQGVPVNTTDESGKTALHHAVAWSTAQEIPAGALALLQLGADASIKDDTGATPGDLARARGRLSLEWLLAHPLTAKLAGVPTDDDSVEYKGKVLAVLADLAKLRAVHAVEVPTAVEITDRASLARIAAQKNRAHADLADLRAAAGTFAGVVGKSKVLEAELASRIAYVRGLRDVDGQVEALREGGRAAAADLDAAASGAAARFADGEEVKDAIQEAIAEAKRKIADAVAARVATLQGGVGTWQQRERSLGQISAALPDLTTEVAESRARCEQLLADSEAKAAAWVQASAKSLEKVREQAQKAASYLKTRLAQIDEEMQLAEAAVMASWKADLSLEKGRVQATAKAAFEWADELGRAVNEVTRAGEKSERRSPPMQRRPFEDDGVITATAAPPSAGANPPVLWGDDADR